MKNADFLALLFASAILSGCENMRPQQTAMSTPEYATKEPIAASLFPSDQAVLSDEAVNRILSSKLELPNKAKLALMKFPDVQGSYGPYYFQNEDYLKLQEAQVAALTQPLLASPHIAEVIPLPSLMIPRQLSLPTLREAAVRMQADSLLVYRVGGNAYTKYRLFAKDKAKAYSTCELVLLDVRTGLVPFARVVTRERLELKQSTDFDLTETTRRAEEGAATDALRAAADELANFIKAVPRKAF